MITIEEAQKSLEQKAALRKQKAPEIEDRIDKALLSGYDVFVGDYWIGGFFIVQFNNTEEEEFFTEELIPKYRAAGWDVSFINYGGWSITYPRPKVETSGFWQRVWSLWK